MAIIGALNLAEFITGPSGQRGQRYHYTFKALGRLTADSIGRALHATMSSKATNSKCRRVTRAGEPCPKRATIGEHCLLHSVSRRSLWASSLGVVSAVLAIGTFFWPFNEWFTPNRPPGPEPRCRSLLAPKGDSFSVSDNFDPSGLMGDIDDVKIERYPGSTVIRYTPTGTGEHEWENKYVNGKLSEAPARFGGVMFLSSPNNWGRQPGFDLRDFQRKITGEARSLNHGSSPVTVTFAIGGVNWEWEHAARKINYQVPCPDSLPRLTWRVVLTDRWTPIRYDLSPHPPEYFNAVVGGFACTIDWDSNQENLKDEAGHPRTIKIEIRNVRYEK